MKSDNQAMGSKLKGRNSRCSAIGIAEVNAGLPFALGGCFFFLLVLGDFFFGVRKGITRREHGVAANLLLLFADGAKFATNKADRCVNHLDFDEKIADFFKKVVKVIRPNYVRKA